MSSQALKTPRETDMTEKPLNLGDEAAMGRLFCNLTPYFSHMGRRKADPEGKGFEGGARTPHALLQFGNKPDLRRSRKDR
jgi:hypothetical protein